MPVNNNLPVQKLPMEVKFNQKPTTEINILERAIDAKLIQYPTYEQLLSYLPNFCQATWEDNPYKEYTREQAEQVLIKMFKGQTLPTAKETIRLTFTLENLTYIEISHILRYRGFSISAQCTADRDQRNDSASIPASIAQSKQFKERYEKLIHEMKQLYTEMVDTKEISIFDARYILPKASTVYYHVSMNFNDLLHFIKQRQDEAIQPQTDNILAYKMWLEVCKVYPILTTLDLVDFDEPSWFFIKTHASGHCSNIYIPSEVNDKHLEYNEKSFLYNKRRNEMVGMDKDAIDVYGKIKQEIREEVEKIKEEYLKNK